MKHFNKTKLADAALERLLVATGRAVGAKTTNVVVKVTQGQDRGVSSKAHNVRRWIFNAPQMEWKSERIDTHGGCSGSQSRGQNRDGIHLPKELAVRGTRGDRCAVCESCNRLVCKVLR